MRGRSYRSRGPFTRCPRGVEDNQAFAGADLVLSPPAAGIPLRRNQWFSATAAFDAKDDTPAC